MNSHLGMLLWALIVGSSFPAVGTMSEGLPPLLLTAIRFAIAALAILTLVWRQSDRWHWLPGSLLVVLAITLLLKRDAANRRPDQYFQPLVR